MKRWLSSSLALIAVFLYFWLVLTKPICRDGFAASLRQAVRMGLRCERQFGALAAGQPTLRRSTGPTAPGLISELPKGFGCEG
jgi:hypothetical protein